MFKVFDVVRVTHYEAKQRAGNLGHIVELIGDRSAYVEFNDETGEAREGQIFDVRWLERVYSATPVEARIKKMYYGSTWAGFSDEKKAELLHVWGGILRGEASFEGTLAKSIYGGTV